MKKLYILGIITLMLTACTGSGSSDGNNTASRQPKRAHELRFLRDLGINPDSMIIDDRWVMPEGEDWETDHNRWLNMDKIQSLGLDQLCDADTANSPIALISVWPIDEHYTMLILHQYLGDSAPLHLVTYDGDGIAMDHLNLGACVGLNLRYWDESQKAAGVETSYISFNDRMMTVERELNLTDHSNKSLWSAKNTDTYEIDQRGYIMHREATPLFDNVPAHDRNRRKIEAASWYSIQDEQAMDAMSNCLIDCPEQLTGMDVFQRLYASPWTTAHWLYKHQDSKLIPLLSQEMKTFDNELINTVLESIHDADQKKFIEQLTH